MQITLFSLNIFDDGLLFEYSKRDPPITPHNLTLPGFFLYAPVLDPDLPLPVGFFTRVKLLSEKLNIGIFILLDDGHILFLPVMVQF